MSQTNCGRQILWVHAQDIATAFPDERRDGKLSKNSPLLELKYAGQQPSHSNAALMANAPTILSLTYQVFNYTAFSCTRPGGQWLRANNTEAIHNNIHHSVGGFGHMQFPEVASCDPVFWLHHANVDRLFAMWQKLNPDSYVDPTVNTYRSYYEAVGFIDSGTTGQRYTEYADREAESIRAG
ncbi:uncharacterized protein Z518_09300 [Rhinocladiella mackenziei CBS 650.93]|uniref:tyrosinase n=1 Tax=Rhinocladiella mackenziei CBS 650.93 TaxID=1442369 RepID=A0A0D2I6Y7_9EURO|nr:uncharacterized protein Z518_09300 [Rhinocladiella mackenziei CBS 650.93]KIX01574.1 hypothetical protein Z518_09300 [Rhinocladiella mackenziei CBS 650.93]